MTFLFTLCLGQILQKDLHLKVPYPVFALSGFLIWNIFSTGIATAGNSMVSNAQIIKKIYFPRLIIPISSIIISLFDFFISFVILIPLLMYYQLPFQTSFFLYFPLSLLLTCLSTFGLGTLFAALNVKYRDFRYIIPFFLQALLFATPVIYPVGLSQNYLLRLILKFNPMSAPVELFRYAFSSDSPIETQTILYSSAAAFLLFFAGLIYFRRTEAYFSDLA
jgi:lipopolysaccharide transport system permease protein